MFASCVCARAHDFCVGSTFFPAFPPHLARPARTLATATRQCTAAPPPSTPPGRPSAGASLCAGRSSTTWAPCRRGSCSLRRATPPPACSSCHVRRHPFVSTRQCKGSKNKGRGAGRLLEQKRTAVDGSGWGRGWKTAAGCKQAGPPGDGVLFGRPKDGGAITFFSLSEVGGGPNVGAKWVGKRFFGAMFSV